MELKTLKDIFSSARRWELIDNHRKVEWKYFIRLEKELKAEAVKCVKFHNWNPKTRRVDAPFSLSEWMHFFNLTEEDLK